MRARTQALFLAFLGVLWLSSAPAKAQFAPTLPFNAYSQPYLPFSYPNAVNISLPNQARQNLLALPYQGPVSLDLPNGPHQGRALGATRGASRYGEADQQFNEDLENREALHTQWLYETDPEKRAEIAKRLQAVNDSLKSSAVSRRRSNEPRRAADPSAAATDDDGTSSRSQPASTRRTAGGQARRARTPAAGPLSTNHPIGALPNNGPSNAARPDAPSNRVAPGARTLPAHPTGRPATTPPASRTPTPRRENDLLTPDEIMERSRNLDRKPATSGTSDPGISEFGPRGTRGGSSVERSRFETGRPLGR